MNEIACANCGEPVVVGMMCGHCQYRDESDWPYYVIGVDRANPDETNTAEEWAEWQDYGGEGG